MRLNAEVKHELYAEFCAHAEAQGRSLSDVVRQLLVEWCARQRREARAKERTDGRAEDRARE
jgi:negative regulator of replication initiation